MTAFSDYIIYVDESGSPVLDADARDFPIFVLVFVVIKKSDYVSNLVPEVQRLKFEFVGHDQIVLHERDIRRQSNDFAFLQVSTEIRESFLGAINQIVKDAEVTLICSVIHKDRLSSRYSNPWSPYDLALTMCMERAAGVMEARGQKGKQVNVVFESRGPKEDQHLELEFRRVSDGNFKIGKNKKELMGQFQWVPMFADKKSNSAGLQFADLVARPIGIKCLRPEQRIRAYEIASPKILYPGPKEFPT